MDKRPENGARGAIAGGSVAGRHRFTENSFMSTGDGRRLGMVHQPEARNGRLSPTPNNSDADVTRWR